MRYMSALLLSTSLRGFVSGQDVDETKPAPPEAAAYEIRIPIGNISSDHSGTSPLGSSGIFDVLTSKSWSRNSNLAAQYYQDGTVHNWLRNEEKPKMSIIKVCGNYFYAPNIYWKGGLTGKHLHQDNKRNQKQFYAGVTQAAHDVNGEFVTRDKPIEIMTERTSSACGSISFSWKSKGNWGRLGDIMDHFLRIWFAPQDTCAVSPSHGGGNGLLCALPCDPISPMWFQSTNLYVRQTRWVNGKQLYSSVYKLRGQFNSGDGNGGLKNPTWLNAQCDGDRLYFKDTPNDATYVVFW
ncbi:hypothetical protein E5D57_000060 [Metarhizium anisopliae]|nr:hypothetical protein E5D57_000060 [Metarhizium anisopliae]